MEVVLAKRFLGEGFLGVKRLEGSGDGGRVFSGFILWKFREYIF